MRTAFPLTLVISLCAWLQLAHAQGAEALPTDARTGRLMGSWENVERAQKRGDLGEAQRLAAWLTSAQWRAALAPSSTGHLKTALSLLPVQVGAVGWLPTLSGWLLVTDPFRQSEVQAVIRTLGDLLDGRQPSLPHEWDVPVRTTRDVCRGLLWIAGAAARPTDLRLAALEALGSAQRTCGVPPNDLLVDPSADIRRAAAALVGSDPATLTALRARLEDDSPLVESMVAARLCQTQAASDALPLVLRSARKFAIEPVAPEDAMDLLDCLSRSANPEDRAALENVLQHGSKPLKQRAKELLGRS